MSVYEEIQAERKRQDEKWGEQNHPIIDPDTVVQDSPVAKALVCDWYGVPSETDARESYEAAVHRDDVAWADVLLEEFSETLEAAVDGEQAARAELVQVAAVAVAAIECIDRRAAKTLRKDSEDADD